MYYCGFTFRETYALPVAYKQWFIERVSKELKSGQDNDAHTSRALHHNTPDARALMGQARAQMPSRLRRFT